MNHAFEDGKDLLELFVIFLFETLNLVTKQFVACQDAAKLNEGPHDRNIDLNGSLAPKHTGKHGHALLGEGIGAIPAAARPLFEIAICDLNDSASWSVS